MLRRCCQRSYSRCSASRSCRDRLYSSRASSSSSPSTSISSASQIAPAISPQAPCQASGRRRRRARRMLACVRGKKSLRWPLPPRPAACRKRGTRTSTSEPRASAHSMQNHEPRGTSSRPMQYVWYGVSQPSQRSKTCSSPASLQTGQGLDSGSSSTYSSSNSSGSISATCLRSLTS
jgi:hypothetical protein